MSDNREWKEEPWLKVCEDWKALASQEPSLHRYILRHYAEDFREAKRWDELFALARDDAFRQAQAEASPAEPDLPLRTVRAAMLGAAERDDAGAMAEFLLKHAWRLLDITQESPLYALRRVNLPREGNWRTCVILNVASCGISESPAKRLGVSCLTWMMREIWGRMPEEFGWGGRHVSEKHRSPANPFDQPRG